MSVRVLSKAFEDRNVRLATRLVLLALADSSWDDGVTWDSQENIARKALVSEQTVRSSLRELENLGTIQMRKAQRGKNRINVYWITYDGLIDVDYDRLPFTIKEPFTTAEVLRSSESHDRKTTHDTTAESRRSSRARGSSLVRKSNGKDSGTKVPSWLEKPPQILQVDGQNEPLNTLMKECGVDPGNRRRVVYAVSALSGKGGDQGIVDLYWLEVVRWCKAHDRVDELEAIHNDRERYSRALAKTIKEKAQKYRDTMDGAHLTPTALRDWWLDLELKQQRGGTMTPADIENL